VSGSVKVTVTPNTAERLRQIILKVTVLTPDEIQKLIAALPLKEGALVFLLTIDVVSRRRRESWVIEQRCLSGSQAVPVSR
jgi:hypothetical protein